MGITLNKFYDYFPQPVTNIYNQIGRKRKREDLDEESVLQQYLEQPKKKKMVCTAKYIYKTLFLDGRDYDIRVDILGKEWKLHKIYLQQSPYFASMFSGSWNESNKSYVKIEIADPNITLDALTVVFGSLYPNDEVTIEPCSVVGILAAASLFQLDGLVEQCLDIMIETISPLTAINYYNAACQYSLNSIKKATFRWFSYNLMHYYVNHPEDLRDISIELMESLVGSKDLCVIQMEYSLYLMLRSWIYLKLHMGWLPEENSGQCVVIQKFFRERPRNEPEFLSTVQGIAFQKAFRGLRLENLIVHHQDLDVILEDRIIPENWLYPTLIALWGSVLQVDKNLDNGPVGVPDNIFYDKCMRMGRVIESKETHTWRWNGYAMGLDLVWSITPRLITVKRHMSQGEISPILMQPVRNFMCRVVVVSQDVQRQVIVEQRSNVLQISLAKFQEHRVMDLEKDFTYPIIISVYLLVTTPKSKTDLCYLKHLAKQEKKMIPVRQKSFASILADFWDWVEENKNLC